MFFIDLAIALAASAATAATALSSRGVEAGELGHGRSDAASFAAFFALVPRTTRGQTLAQKLLRLRIVRTDATPGTSTARWYGLALFGWAPFSLLLGVLISSGTGRRDERPRRSPPAPGGRQVDGLMTAWAVSLAVRRAGARKRPFVMLNGVLSGTRS